MSNSAEGAITGGPTLCRCPDVATSFGAAINLPTIPCTKPLKSIRTAILTMSLHSLIVLNLRTTSPTRSSCIQRSAKQLQTRRRRRRLGEMNMTEEFNVGIKVGDKAAYLKAGAR